MAKKTCISEQTLKKLKDAFGEDKEVLFELETLGTCRRRKPSDYQLFVGKCIKGGGTIPSCATEWNKQKGK